MASRILITCGAVAILSGLAILGFTFYPILFQEVSYQVHKGSPVASKTISPIDTSFGIVIPKIAANAHIIANVDPYNSSVYQRALTKGVAQAKGTALPGHVGDMFLFSHSSLNFYEAVRFNSVFYLLTKLSKGDDIDIYYNNTKYSYIVTSTEIVEAQNVSYLSPQKTGETLTLMTCWPAGTNLKRFLVHARLTTQK